MDTGFKHKTHKCASIEIGYGYTLEVVKDFTRLQRPYLLYVTYYDNAKRRRRVDAFDSMVDALKQITDLASGAKDWCI